MEVSGEPVVACGDPAEVFEPAEHSLDRVLVPIQVRREAILPDPVGLRRDIRCGSRGFYFPAHGIGVVAFVPMHQFGRGDLIEQRVRRHAIGNLSAGQQERNGAAVLVGQGVDFGRASAARAADRLAALPPLMMARPSLRGSW